MPRYQPNSQDSLNRAQPPPYSDGAQCQQDEPIPPFRRGYPSYTEHSSLLVQSFTNRKAIGPSRGLIVMMLLLCAVIGYLSNTFVNQEWHDMLARNIAREENQLSIKREEWNAEVHQHEERRAKMHQDRRDWDREAKEKADEERRRQQDEIRQRESITWSGLGPSSHCLRYGVREYTAILTNVPLGFNAVEECWRKLIEIHGRDWIPTSCEDQGICGHVTGHWKVDHNEGGCSPWWSYFKDKGCVQPGIRRHEAPLENLQGGDNWQDMCSTTPANINGIHYDGPTSCVDWGKYGKWGIWLINDNSCW